MWEFFKNNILWYIKGLLFELGEPSLTRLLAILSFLLFAGVSLYLMLYGIKWDMYPTFASITGGGGLVAQVANKYANSKYNSIIGMPSPSAYGSPTILKPGSVKEPD